MTGPTNYLKVWIAALCVFVLFQAAYPETNAAGTQRMKIALADFDIKGNVEIKDAGKSIAELLGVSLQKTGLYDIYERTQLQKLIDEQKLSVSGLLIEETTVKIGKLTGVQFLVIGSVIEFGGIFTISARMIDADTGRIVQSGSIRGNSAQQVLDKIESLSQQLQGKPVSDIEDKQSGLTQDEIRLRGKQYAAVLGILSNNGLEVVLNMGSSDGVAIGDNYNIFLPNFEQSRITKKVIYTGNVKVGYMSVSYIEPGMCLGRLVLDDPSPGLAARVEKEGIADYRLSKILPFYLDITGNIVLSSLYYKVYLSIPITLGIDYFPLNNIYFWVGLDAGFEALSFQPSSDTLACPTQEYFFAGGRAGVFIYGSLDTRIRFTLDVGFYYHPMDPDFSITGFTNVYSLNIFDKATNIFQYTNGQNVYFSIPVCLGMEIGSSKGSFICRIGADFLIGNFKAGTSATPLLLGLFNSLWYRF